MGCDIHAHTEVKIDGVWHHWSSPNIGRSYALFSRMADVRNGTPGSDYYVEPISQPRGLPDDATFLTRFDSERWGIDGHSHSWLSGAELAALEKWYSEQRRAHVAEGWYSWHHDELGYLFGNGWDVAKYPQDYPKGVEDARIIFWFDN